MGVWDQFQEVIFQFDDEGTRNILSIVLVVGLAVLIMLFCVYKYLLKRDSSQSTHTISNQRMTPYQYKKHVKSTTEQQLYKLTTSPEYERFLRNQLTGQNQRRKANDSIEEIVFSDEEQEGKLPQDERKFR